MKYVPSLKEKLTHKLWRLKSNRLKAKVFAKADTPLIICTVFRNEAPFLKEWILFHQKQGVEKFYLADNNSEDNFKKILEPFIQKGLVQLSATKTDEMNAFIQAEELNKLLVKAKQDFGENCWVASIDVDEFLFSTIQPIKELLNAQKGEKPGAILVNWLFFGTAHVKEIDTDKSFLEQFQLRAKADLREHALVKPICYLANTVGFYGGPHVPFVKKKATLQYSDGTIYNKEVKYITHTPLRINHYWFRSENYFYSQKRFNRNRFGSLWNEKTEQLFVDACNEILDKKILDMTNNQQSRIFNG